MSVKTNNKLDASQLIMDLNSVKDAIKENSRGTLQELLKESVEDFIREAINADAEDEEEKTDFEEIETEDTVDNDTETQEAPDVEGEGEGEADTEETETEEETEVEDESDEDYGFDEYEVSDDTYDLTGEKDINKLVKVYKLIDDDDQVLIKNVNGKIELHDEETGAEYVIDLGTDDSCDGGYCEETMSECIKEDIGDEPAGFADDEFINDEDIFDEEDIVEESRIYEFVDDDDEDDELSRFLKDPKNRLPSKKEQNKARRSASKDISDENGEMDENKNETIVEMDLGYTDNYQKTDVVSGLSNNEPSKSGRTWDKGVPQGTKKPWAGETKSKGEPFEETVNEEVEEGTNVGGAVQQRSNSKSHIPANRKEYGPKVKRHVSTSDNGYDEMVENIKKQNKFLKESLVKLQKNLLEAQVANVSLAKITKLFTENAVTLAEKKEIVDRFSNEADTIEKANKLYESYKKKLNANTANKQLTMENKNEVSAVENKAILAESKDQSLLNTLDLIRRVEEL